MNEFLHTWFYLETTDKPSWKSLDDKEWVLPKIGTDIFHFLDKNSEIPKLVSKLKLSIRKVSLKIEEIFFFDKFFNPFFTRFALGGQNYHPAKLDSDHILPLLLPFLPTEKVTCHTWRAARARRFDRCSKKKLGGSLEKRVQNPDEIMVIISVFWWKRRSMQTNIN